MKKIVIVGAGISGLVAGVYAKYAGFDVEIYESHNQVGGFCTSWKRNGYELDGCIHWLTGVKPNTDLYKMWTDVGAFSSTDDIIFLDSFCSTVYQGTQITFWRDIDRLEKEWIEISKEDKKEIKNFVYLVKAIGQMQLPLSKPVELMNMINYIKAGCNILPSLFPMLTTTNLSLEKYAKRFHHPAIRFAISHAQPGDGNLFAFLFSYGTLVVGNGGVPKDGSLVMSKKIATTFKDLGGKIFLNSKVDKIVVCNGTAQGIALENGKFVAGDYVVSSPDVHVTLEKLLENKYRYVSIDNRMKNEKKYPSPSAFTIYYAIEHDFSDKPTQNIIDVEPFNIANSTYNHLTIRNYSYDKRYIRNGKTIVSVLIDQYNKDYSYWDELYKNKDRYNEKKREISDFVISQMIKKMPELEGKITYIDSYSPATLNRYTGAYKGSYMSFMLTPHSFAKFNRGHIKGIKNLVLAGQWMQMPGGLPLAGSTGKFAIQRIVCQERKYFFPTFFHKTGLFVYRKKRH